MVLVIKHVLQLLWNLVAYSWSNEIWWPMPVVLALLIIGFLAVTTQVAMPYIYTLF